MARRIQKIHGIFLVLQSFGESATQVTNITTIVEQCKKEAQITPSMVTACGFGDFDNPILF
jgi:hypothetical protein